MTKALMFQGTGSDVGKTVLVAGLCRLASNYGIKTMPFKPQNMSNNAAVADDGGEIGRGQWLQARAARVMPSVHINPVLLKPQSEMGSQVVVHGQSRGYVKANAYRSMKSELLEAILTSFEKLRSEADLILIEGAGSPAEINLREGDIANMGFAEAVRVPVVLIGDIDRGGVIASLVGTHKILPQGDRDLIKAYLINKFRGDVSLFEGGITAINNFTGWPCLGIIPWLDAVHKLPPEDSVVLSTHQARSNPDKANETRFRIAIARLPRIANFDDFDPLIAEPGVKVEFISSGEKIPHDAKLVILPGSKSTIADLAYLKQEGWCDMLRDHIARGGYLLGICGGYQMLGNKIYDHDHVESCVSEIEGFGLLDLQTSMAREKITRNVTAQSQIYQAEINGYEIHIGNTSGQASGQASGQDHMKPFATIDGRPDGAVSADGRIMGTYLHGLFTSDEFRNQLLEDFGVQQTRFNYNRMIDEALNELADELNKYLDFNALLKIAGMPA